MKRIYFPTIIVLASLALPAYIFSQNRPGDNSSPVTIPESLRRPLRGEAPRYPRDMVIGELGQGTAPERAWRHAREIASALVARNLSSSVIPMAESDLLEEYFPILHAFEPRKYHLGGGRIEVDGSVSFLVRFLGREQWMAGELYLRPEADSWRLDDLILEEVRNFEEGKNSYTYDFSPYERFF